MNKKLSTNEDGLALVLSAMPQAELARRLGISRQSINDWKSKGLPLRRVDEISVATGVPVAKMVPETWRQVSQLLSCDSSHLIGKLAEVFLRPASTV